MSKIRTTSEFESKMDQESSWRIKELAYIRELASHANDASPASRVALRAAHALLYAHWEGWVKTIAGFYLDYLRGNPVPIRDLNDGLAGSALRRRFRELSESPRHSVISKFTSFILGDGLDKRATFDEDTIDTESNLKPRVLEDIVLKLGLDYKKYSTKENLINSQLVHTRNTIAHGQFTALPGDPVENRNTLVLAREKYMELHDTVVGLLRTFHEDVMDAVMAKKYMR